MFTPGPLQLLIVAAIVLLLFGSRLPGAMRSLGRSVVEFKKGIKESGEEDSDEPGKPASDAKDDPKAQD